MASNRHLECSVCLEEYSAGVKVPKGLFCQHTFCLPCLRGLCQNDQIQCPQCRYVQAIPSADNLFTNHVILEMSQNQSRQMEKETQKMMRQEIEDVSDEISKYRAFLGRRVAFVEDMVVKLNVSASKTKDSIAANITHNIELLQERQKQLFTEVDSVNKRLREEVTKDAQADFEETTRLKQFQGHLLMQDQILKVQHDNFKKEKDSVKKVVEKKLKNFQEIQVKFDTALMDGMKVFGHLEVPVLVQPPPVIPWNVTRMMHTNRIGMGGSEPAQFKLPAGIAITNNGTVLVADVNNSRIQEVDMNGDMIQSIGSEGNDDGQFQSPSTVVVDSANRIYVSEAENNRIQVFDESGTFLFKFGERGRENGQFKLPCGLALDEPKQLLYVANKQNHRIDVFDMHGNYIRQMGNAGDTPDPFGLVLHGNRLYVSCPGAKCIVVYRTNGEKLMVFGKKDDLVQFTWPGYMATDPYGRILIADRKSHRIFILDGETGSAVHVFGSKGTRPGQFHEPIGVALTPAGQLIVSEAVGNRLQVFNFQ